MLVVVLPFLRDYAAILDTSLDNMTVFLPDFSINDIQAAQLSNTEKVQEQFHHRNLQVE